MKKLFLISAFSLFLFSSFTTSSVEEHSDEDVCRGCATVLVETPDGGLQAATACAGGPFTSCEKAGQLAAAKAAKLAKEIGG